MGSSVDFGDFQASAKKLRPRVLQRYSKYKYTMCIKFVPPFQVVEEQSGMMVYVRPFDTPDEAVAHVAENLGRGLEVATQDGRTLSLACVSEQRWLVYDCDTYGKRYVSHLIRTRNPPQRQALQEAIALRVLTSHDECIQWLKSRM